MAMVQRLVRLICLTAVLFSVGVVRSDDAVSEAANSAREIDTRLIAYWKSAAVVPAARADDAAFLRRVSLDLIGRIPTPDEYTQFKDDDAATRRTAVITRLMGSPEFPIHFARVLDSIIQDTQAGDSQFLAWLEQSLAENRPWDGMFRQMMLGPWKSDDAKSSIRFLDRRTKDVDALTVDAARAFFGVDISCARCHDHPLVEDWKQDHYYGLQAFFNRTTGGKGKISEKKDGEVTFVGHDGQEQTARPMFLSGVFYEPVVLSTVGDAPSGTGEQSDPKSSVQTAELPIRREQLVELALRDEIFFRRAFVNQLWDWFFGRGLIDPVDQMHSRNAPTVPGLLEWLADDFASSGYDVRHLITAVVLSEAWQRDSRVPETGDKPEAGAFAVARLRPLTRNQLAESFVLAVADPDAEHDVGTVEWRRNLTEQAKPLLSAFDPKRRGFESSSGEALFLANSTEIQDLIAVDESSDADEFVLQSVRCILTREATPGERDQLRQYLQSNDPTLRKALIWALAGSAEFRFNH